MHDEIIVAIFTLFITLSCGWLDNRISRKISKFEKEINGKLEELRFKHMGFLLDEINRVDKEQIRLKTQADIIFNSIGDGIVKFFHRDNNAFGMDEIIDEIKKRLDGESVQMVADYEKHSDLGMDGWIRLKEKIGKILKEQGKPDETTGIFMLAYLFCIHKLMAYPKGIEALRQVGDK
jgi:hypothetical protein